MAHHSIISRFFSGIVSVLTCLLLTYSIFGAGLFACTTPEATNSIGTSFADWDNAIFPEDDMAAIAEGVRSFAVDGTSSDELYSVIANVMARNFPNLASSFSSLAEQYTLPQNALQHLSDCTPLFQGGKASVVTAGTLGIIGLVVLGFLRGRRRVGSTMMWAAVLAAALVAGLGIWAAINFESLFTAMHSVLFTQGNWMFDAKSLLIQLFPTAFWVAMAGLWAITDLAAALLVFIAGKIVK